MHKSLGFFYRHRYTSDVIIVILKFIYVNNKVSLLPHQQLHFSATGRHWAPLGTTSHKMDSHCWSLSTAPSSLDWQPPRPSSRPSWASRRCTAGCTGDPTCSRAAVQIAGETSFFFFFCIYWQLRRKHIFCKLMIIQRAGFIFFLASHPYLFLTPVLPSPGGGGD